MSLKKYKKVKYLGKGSYGAAILVCLKSNPKENFVIKEIVIGHLKNAEQQSAKNEVEVLRQMHHSNIAMYVESFVENSKLYIVMEYADGGDLTGVVNRRKKAGQPWEEDEVMRIFVQICLALKHVHDQNILHRDLKSQNIFLTNNGIVKLGDFGIAKVLDASGDQARTQIGTPYYLSPEICESHPYGRSSDIWSLGVVLYELLTLELPFTAQSLPALVIKICTADPSWKKVEEVYSPQIIALTRQMIMKNPQRRPSVIDIVHTEFVILHISRLLSHTIRMGKSGAESVVHGSEGEACEGTGSLDPEKADRSIERERERQRKESMVQERLDKEAQYHQQRAAKREEEREKLRKFRQDAARRDIVGSDLIVAAAAPAVHERSVSEPVIGSYAPQVKLAPAVVVRRPSMGDEVAAVREEMRQKELKHQQELVNIQQQRHADEMRYIYMQNQAQARENKLRVARHDINESRAGDALEIYDRGEKKQKVSTYENAARREFFANREAAIMIKQRVERYERGVGGNSRQGGARLGAGAYAAPNEAGDYDEYIDRIGGQDRISLVKAQRERVRVRENAEREYQLKEAYEETRAAKARLAEQRRLAAAQNDITVSPAAPDHPERQPHSGRERSFAEVRDNASHQAEPVESHYERQCRIERQKEEETRKREKALKYAAEQERLQRQLTRAAGRQEAIAFEIDLSEDAFDLGGPAGVIDADSRASSERIVPGDDQLYGKAKNPYSKRSKNHLRSDRGIRRDGNNCIDQKVSRQPISPAPSRRSANRTSGGRARREWGAPVDPFKPRTIAIRARGMSSDATEMEDENALLPRMPSASDMSDVASEVREGEEAVLKVLAARHDREEQSRFDAKENFQKLREKHRQSATKDRQKVRRVETRSDETTAPDESRAGNKKKIHTPEVANHQTPIRSSGVVSSNARPSLDDILRKVAEANEAVHMAMRFGKDSHVTLRRGSGDGSVGESSSTSKKMSRGRNKFDMDEDTHIFAFSSGSDYDGVEIGLIGNDRDTDGLEKTLDTWLSRQRKQVAMKHTVDDALSESKMSKEGREQRRKLLGEGKDWHMAGYDEEVAEEVAEEPGVVVYSESGCGVVEGRVVAREVEYDEEEEEDAGGGDDDYDDDDF